jgi:hypothetical protein
MKVVDLKKLYNFLIWIRLGSQTLNLNSVEIIWGERKSNIDTSECEVQWLKEYRMRGRSRVWIPPAAKHGIFARKIRNLRLRWGWPTARGLPGLKNCFFSCNFLGPESWFLENDLSYKYDLQGRLAKPSYKSTICSNGLVGAAGQTAPTNHLEPPLQII